jgi:hypothetical protein
MRVLRYLGQYRYVNNSVQLHSRAQDEEKDNEATRESQEQCVAGVEAETFQNEAIELLKSTLMPCN